MSAENTTPWPRLLEALITLVKTIAEHPISFVAGFFCTLFFIWQFWGREDCTYWKQQYEIERNKNNALQNALLIKNGIIDGLKEQRTLQDSLIRDLTMEETEKLLNYENP